MSEEKFKPRKFRSLVNERGLDDGGCASFVFETDVLVKGKIYTQADPSSYCENSYARKSPPFFVDDISCSRDIANALRNGIIEEIFD